MVAFSVAEIAAREQSGASMLASLFHTVGNMGFATIRSGYSPPDQPVPQAAADWLLVDLSNMSRWSASLSPACVGFDTTRFETTASLIRSTRPPARQLYQIIDQLHRDYRTALQASTCAFESLNRQYLDAFYITALFTGFATGRASYFYYDTPTPPEIATQIAGDFSTVRAAFAALQGCLGPLTAVESQMNAVASRVGVVSGKQTYTEVAALYQTIEAFVTNARCPASTLSPPDATGPQGGSCMQTKCAQACQGAQMLLGVVSGPPACQACMAQNCGR
jgi:hypothetical protein